jgi:ethanolamine utilization protein EutJ
VPDLSAVVKRAPAGPPPFEQVLDRAEAVLLPRLQSERLPAEPVDPGLRLRIGVDLGTAYLVMVVLDRDGWPLAGEWQPAEVARDGLVVDFAAAADLLRGMKDRLERRLGRPLTHAASGYPPGVPRIEVRATAHVLEAAGLECSGLLDEPTAANNLLHLTDGVLVDVGGGTTGLALIENGKITLTADEATGGRHFSLVIAGALNQDLAEAERLKTTPGEQARLFPLVRPVMEKVAAIVKNNLSGRPAGSITLVGGGSAFPGMAQVVEEYTGLPTRVVSRPLFVTPIGIALHDPAR